MRRVVVTYINGKTDTFYYCKECRYYNDRHYLRIVYDIPGEGTEISTIFESALASYSVNKMENSQQSQPV